MKFSKMFLMLMLTMVLILGTMGSAFAVQDYDKLSLDVEPSNNWGTITGTSSGWHEDGTQVSLTATPKTGYGFKYWKYNIEDDNQGWFTEMSNPLTFTLKKNTECIAYFGRLYPLTVQVDSGSTGMGTVSESGNYLEGTVVPVTAYPGDDYYFVKWMKYCSCRSSNLGNVNPLNFTMLDEPVTLKAFFAEKPDLTIMVNPDDPALGEVTGASDGKFVPGQEISLTASPTVRGAYFTEWSFDPSLTPISDVDGVLTFKMPDNDLEITAHFAMADMPNVLLIPNPSDKGNPMLDENAMEGDEGFDGKYYMGEKFQVMPEPVDHWHFYSYVVGDHAPIMDENYEFTMGQGDMEITVNYEEDYFVEATIKYLNASDVSIKDDDENVPVYLGDYLFAPPAISGYTFGVSSANASGTITEESEDFVVIHKYYVPEVVTNTVTNTVTETVFVNVPATTEATTELPTEPVPLGAAENQFVPPYDVDSTLEVAPVEEIMITEEVTPLADALPQTGQLPGELFYGIGGLVSAVGVFMKRKFNK